MPQPHRSAHPSRAHRSVRRESLRLLAVVLSIIALLLTSSALNWVTEASAADEVPPDGPKRAVIVSGPVHSYTQSYKDYAKAIAAAAEAQGMDVTRILHPDATKAAVIEHANGADLFVYVGHGNGWPSPYGPFQEDTKNGLGLNPDDPEKRTTSNVLYKGANWLRDNIVFAPNAVIILSHLSYASGNASSGMAIPTREVAVERIDNFANGFLSCGARVVWALGWQPGADIVDALHEEDASMDAVFMTRYRSNANPLNGWIGHNPGYYDSVRIPGARVHIDPDPTYGYLRGITGDLGFTTTEWRKSGDRPADVDPPVISEVAASEAPATLATDDSQIPVFTPNDDGVSDSIAISYRLTENAFVRMEVKRDGKVLRERSVWSLKGRGSLTWDGRRDNGEYVGEARYRIVLTPTDRAGNEGESAAVKVRVLNSMKQPTVEPELFYPSDGDGIADETRLRARITRDANAKWIVMDKSGTIVRHGLEGDVTPGFFRFDWDGTDDEGAQVKGGKYRARITVTRPTGTYAHELGLRITSFQATLVKGRLVRGKRITLLVESAEPLKGKPVVKVKQRFVPAYTLQRTKITKLSPTLFKVTWTTRNARRAGPMRVRVTGTDVGGGSQSKLFKLSLR